MAEAWSITSVTPLPALPVVEAARSTRQGNAEVESEPQPPRQPYANAAAHRLLLGALLLSMTVSSPSRFASSRRAQCPVEASAPAHESNRARSQADGSSTPSDAREAKSGTVVSAAAGGAAAEAQPAQAPPCAHDRRRPRIQRHWARGAQCAAAGSLATAREPRQPLSPCPYGVCRYQSTDLVNATPHLTALAMDGVRLSSYYGQQMCTPARATLMTGRWAPTSDWAGTSDTAWSRAQATDEPGQLLPQHMRAHG